MPARHYTLRDLVVAMNTKDYATLAEVAKKAPLLYALLHDDPMKAIEALDMVPVQAVEKRLREALLGEEGEPIDMGRYPAEEEGEEEGEEGEEETARGRRRSKKEAPALDSFFK